MFMCNVTKTSPYLRNFVNSDDYRLFANSDVSIRFNGKYDNVLLELRNRSALAVNC